MEQLFYVLLGIIALFFILLIVKGFLRGKAKEKFCVICFSVILTWIVLLILYWKGNFDNPVIIGILIGESVLGIFYFAENKVKKELHLFRLPFLLTLIFLAYLLININNVQDITNSIFLLFIMWVLFFLFYFYKNNSIMSKFVNKIIECCKRI